MKLSEVGEFGLIDRLGDLLGEAPEGETWIGDDAAVLRAPGGTILVSVALLGNPAGRRVIERRGARPGDVICVTGTLGAAAAGFRLMKAGQPVPPALRAALLRPVPRVREVEVLRRFLPNAMIDVSD